MTQKIDLRKPLAMRGRRDGDALLLYEIEQNGKTWGSEAIAEIGQVPATEEAAPPEAPKSDEEPLGDSETEEESLERLRERIGR